MKVTILGNNSALPAFGRHPTAQALQVWGEMLLIDCGEGTQVQMHKYGLRTRNLHHIFISHMHGDHYFGLPGLINSMSLLGRVAPLHLYAPAALQPIIDQIQSTADTELSYPFHFHALPDGGGMLIDNESFSVESFPVEHRIPCYGFKVTSKTRGRKLLPDKCREYEIPRYYYDKLKQGFDYERMDGTIIKNEWVTDIGPHPKTYAYCADTIFTDSYLPYTRDADMIYHESTYLEKDADKATARYHCTAKQAAEIARMSNAKKLLLGHYSSKYKDPLEFAAEAAAIFENVEASIEGNTYLV
ncbi:MAG: ribonuclease Z [Bacteroidetes bacterium]|nr:ribonuclease Z [Bacteroidota bacterium]